MIDARTEKNEKIAGKEKKTVDVCVEALRKRGS